MHFIGASLKSRCLFFDLLASPPPRPAQEEQVGNFLLGENEAQRNEGKMPKATQQVSEGTRNKSQGHLAHYSNL